MIPSPLDYLPEVAWRTLFKSTYINTESTEIEPALWDTTIYPINDNEKGASPMNIAIGYYAVDTAGHIFTITQINVGSNPYRITVRDDFRCNLAPLGVYEGFVYKSVGDGIAPFIPPVVIQRLDKTARDYINSIEKDILWKNKGKLPYIAYASDDTGTDFTLDPTSKLPYEAKLISDVKIETPVVTDFVGLWRSGGGGSLPITVDCTTNNSDNGETHTHKLGAVSIKNVVQQRNVGYGLLYKQSCISDSRKLSSSDDWDVLTNSENESLITYLGTGSANKTKSTRTVPDDHPRWDASMEQENATNETGMSLLPAGMRYGHDGAFVDFGYATYLWSKTTWEFSGEHYGNDLFAISDSEELYTDSTTSSVGKTIRLANKNTTLANGSIGSYVGNNGIIYPTVVVNGIEIIQFNLLETRYRDNSSITKVESNADWVSRGYNEAFCYPNNDTSMAGGDIPLIDLLISEHNLLTGLQGGTVTERYHLTENEKIALHIESAHLSGLSSKNISITFDAPFSNIPTGFLKVFRMKETSIGSGKWKQYDVLYYHDSATWLTVSGFTLIIETNESLTGIEIMYLFK